MPLPRSADEKKTLVPFLATEWETVAKCFVSDSVSDWFEALQAVTAWQLRFSTGIPAAVCLTEIILKARLNEAIVESNNDIPLWCKAENIRSFNSLAIIRFVNFVYEISQPPGCKAISIKLGVKEFNIPEWIVELRHGATHSANMPASDLCRKAIDYLWDWLKDYYWNFPMAHRKEMRVKSRKFDVSYEFYTNLIARCRGCSGKIPEAMKNIRKRMFTKFGYDLLHVLRSNQKDEFLALLADSLLFDQSKLRKCRWFYTRAILPPFVLQVYWRRVFKMFRLMKKIFDLLSHLFTKLNETTDDVHYFQYRGWILLLMSDKNFAGICANQNKWYELLIRHVSQSRLGFDQNIVVKLLEKIPTNLEESKRTKIEELMKLYRIENGDDRLVRTLSPTAVDRLVSAPIIDITDESIAQMTSDQRRWQLSKEKSGWHLCPLGLLPHQTAKTLDLRFKPKNKGGPQNPEHCGDDPLTTPENFEEEDPQIFDEHFDEDPAVDNFEENVPPSDDEAGEIENDTNFSQILDDSDENLDYLHNLMENA